MFLYNTQPEFYPGGFFLNNYEIEINKIDANGQEVGPEDFGASPDPYDPFIFEFEADGVASAVECRNWRDFGEAWSITFYGRYEGNTNPKELTFGGTSEPEPSALFAGEINVESMFVGETPVSAAYVGNAQVYPSKVVPDYQMEVWKKNLGWNLYEGKYYIEYTINNTGQEPMFVTAEILRATGQEMAPGKSITATFSAPAPGTYNLAITARTINDYVFDVYEDEVNVPSKDEPLTYRFYALNGNDIGSAGNTIHTFNPRTTYSPPQLWFNDTDIDFKTHPFTGSTWTIEGEGQKEVLNISRWELRGDGTDNRTKTALAHISTLNSTFTDGEIWTMREGEW